MLIISHRGNVDGKKPEKENSPDYIDEAIKLGYSVEIDLRCVNEEFYLGHDEPQYKIDFTWLFARRENLFIHLKEINIINFVELSGFHCFAHDVEKWTITNFFLGWTTHKKYLNRNCIWVINDKKEDLTNLKIYGICTDYANYYNTLQK